jgi:hypothetical protein
VPTWPTRLTREENRVSTNPLSTVQYLNFVVLTLLRETIARDPVQACAAFGLHRDQLEQLEPLLSPDRIVAAVANGGPECLLTPRGDLVALLSRPVPLVGALASVSPPTAAPRPSAARSAAPLN